MQNARIPTERLGRWPSRPLSPRDKDDDAVSDRMAYVIEIDFVMRCVAAGFHVYDI